MLSNIKAGTLAGNGLHDGVLLLRDISVLELPHTGVSLM